MVKHYPFLPFFVSFPNSATIFALATIALGFISSKVYMLSCGQNETGALSSLALQCSIRALVKTRKYINIAVKTKSYKSSCDQFCCYLLYSGIGLGSGLQFCFRYWVKMFVVGFRVEAMCRKLLWTKSHLTLLTI